MGKNRFIEDNILDDIMSVNSDMQISAIKKEISSLLTKDIKIIAKNDSQKNLIKSIKNNEITICAGPAGTGKTYVAMAYALSLLRKVGNRFKKIYLVKSVTTLKNEEVGFLKGDLKEKTEPVMWSFYLNMEKLVLGNSLKTLVEKEIIRPMPLAFIRGASLDDCIIIADEMQNVSLDNSRTLLTRIGSNCKLIVLGDTNQIDIRNKNESSLETFLSLFDEVEKVGVIKMSEADTNIRNPLISVIEKKYNEHFILHGNGNGKILHNKKPVLNS